jgi:hypothetical protein
MNLFSSIQNFLSQGALDQISGQIGAENPQQTQTATNDIITSMIGAMSKNASTEQGAESLNNALEKDHDGSIFGNMGFFGSMFSGENQSGATNGSGILKHLFGNQQQKVTQQVSQNSGLNESSVSSLMTMLAPLVMGQLGQVKQQNGMGSNDLQQYLQQEKQQTAQQNPQAGNMLSFLDSDGDGDIMDDLGGMFKKLF